MGVKSWTLALAVLLLSWQALAEDEGNGIVEDVKKAFQGEDIFNISAATGMSPKVPGEGVWSIAAPLASAAGNWSLELMDLNNKSTMRLTLFQSDDAVSGFGEATRAGSSVQVTANGTIIGKRLALDVMLPGTPSLYRMNLTVNPGSMNGSYEHSGEGTVQLGVVFGRGESAQAGQQAGQQPPLMLGRTSTLTTSGPWRRSYTSTYDGTTTTTTSDRITISNTL